MALSPKCPEGFEWLPQFGNGKSCFKITEHNPVECNPSCYYDLTIVDIDLSPKFETTKLQIYDYF